MEQPQTGNVSDQSVPMATCPNCKKTIEKTKINMHIPYCRRNVKKCEKCDEMVQKDEMEIHEYDVHR